MRIVNKKTNKAVTVSEEGWKAIEENPLTRGLYSAVPKAEEPEEVTTAKIKRRAANPAGEETPQTNS